MMRSVELQIACFNRNIVECKWGKSLSVVVFLSRFNRNIVECKWYDVAGGNSFHMVLIETLWNVNLNKSVSFLKE